MLKHFNYIWFLLAIFIFKSAFAINSEAVVNIDIRGVNCPFCLNVLVKNVNSLENVNSAKLSVDNSKLTVTYKPNSKPSLELLTKTIKASGYEPLKLNQQMINGSDVDVKNVKMLMSGHMTIGSQACNSCHTK